MKLELASALVRKWRDWPGLDQSDNPVPMEAIDALLSHAAPPPSAPDRDPMAKHKWDRMDRPRICTECGYEEHDGSGLGYRDCNTSAIGALALPPSGVAEMVREMCAKVADETRAKFGSPTGPAYDNGLWDQSVRIASAIRSLDLSNKGVG